MGRIKKPPPKREFKTGSLSLAGVAASHPVHDVAVLVGKVHDVMCRIECLHLVRVLGITALCTDCLEFIEHGVIDIDTVILHTHIGCANRAEHALSIAEQN